jgi:hypothetical protein
MASILGLCTSGPVDVTLFTLCYDGLGKDKNSTYIVVVMLRR